MKTAIEQTIFTLTEMIVELVDVTKKQLEAIAQQQVETQRIWQYLMKQIDSKGNGSNN